jgi:hypothetical protein
LTARNLRFLLSFLLLPVFPGLTSCCCFFLDKFEVCLQLIQRLFSLNTLIQHVWQLWLSISISGNAAFSRGRVFASRSGQGWHASQHSRPQMAMATQKLTPLGFPLMILFQTYFRLIAKGLVSESEIRLGPSRPAMIALAFRILALHASSSRTSDTS